MKKLLSLALVLCMLLSAGAALAENVVLKVWGSQDDQAMLQEMVENFKAANAGKTYDITFGVVGEPDAKTKYLEDPSAAADVFAFADDQLPALLSADALYEVTINKDAIVAANIPSAVEAASSGDHLYAYPMTADNGYFLYYDKSVISEEQVQTLDGILEASKTAGRKMLMDVSNGWYIASFFLGAGCELKVGEDKKIICDFNNEAGVAAGEAIKAFTAHEAFMTGDVNTMLPGGIGETVSAGVAGAWLADAVKEKLGDNYGATKLPTFTCAGEQVQMGSFAGFKLVGVNTMTMFPEDAMALAEFLTNEENQLKRFEVRGLGPSNINVASSEQVQSNLALAALAAQAPYASSQAAGLDNYWSPAEAFGTTMEAKDYAKDVKTLLDEMVAAITQ